MYIIVIYIVYNPKFMEVFCMSLKLSVNQTEYDALDTGVKSFYEQKDDMFVLPIEGAVPKGKLDEFRANNINYNPAHRNDFFRPLSAAAF